MFYIYMRKILRQIESFFLFFVLSCALCLLGLPLDSYAQDADKAEGYFSQYVEYVRSGNVSVEAYDALMRSHREYINIIRSNPSGSEAHTSAQTKLGEMYDPIQHAINFFNKNTMTEKLVNAARAYVDLMIYCPTLPIHPMHVPITRLAAINTANLVAKTDPTTEGFARAIPYLVAYLQTDDTSKENRMEQAYCQLGAFSYNIKDYAQSYKVLKKGLTAYPDDSTMLEYMLKTLQRIGQREEELQSYLTRALASNPDNQHLLELQANLYSKSGNDEDAVEFLEKLHAVAPYHHGYMKSLAFHYCNLGFKMMESSNKEQNKKLKASKKENSKQYFISAAKLLETLSEGEFSESERMRYTQALAYVYGYIDDKKKQEQAVDNLKDSGVAQHDVSIAFADLASEGTVKHYANGGGRKDFKVEEHFEVDDVRNSDVDVHIPVAEQENSQTFVVIIANENYDEVSKVPYAHNDGSKFKEYCHLTLGIPADNIDLRKDATGGQILNAISHLQQMTAVHSNANVIFYYAGHGYPDEKNLSTYLVPSDGFPTDPVSLFSLKNLYSRLSALPAEHVYVFMDACFSGAQRGEGMIVAARSLAARAKKEEPQGRMVVFSAAQGDESAMEYKEKQHGMFTYFLLKKLQETQGQVTLGELGEYITTNVKQTSVRINKKLQTPNISGSLKMNDGWEDMPLVNITLQNSLN